MIRVLTAHARHIATCFNVDEVLLAISLCIQPIAPSPSQHSPLLAASRVGPDSVTSALSPHIHLTLIRSSSTTRGTRAEHLSAAWHPRSPSDLVSGSKHATTMIDVTRRLRRAVHRNDLDLVRRIVTNEPHVLRNPDYDDKSNTSLHLAAKEGFVEIAAFLIEAGHEDEGISHNADWDTPLMLAAVNRQTAVGELLVRHFPRCVPWTNKAGMDALMLASRHGTYSLLPPLLTCPTPASVHTHDRDGNTALHHASAAGELKALRLLLQFGASPLAQNAYSWTPVAYSATASAELYFKSLVAEIEKQRVEMGGRERGRPVGGGVRLVTSEDALGVQQQQRAVDDEGVGMGVPQFEGNWSPVEQRRAMTPTAGRSDAWPGSAAALRGAPPLPSAGGNVMRQRAESGE